MPDTVPTLLTTKSQVRDFVADAKNRGQRIGLVPTMGAIHQGHQSLVRRALRDAQTVVASVFVNPTQFAPTEDFDAYPRTLDDDLRLLGQAGAAAVFAPSVAEMYGQQLARQIRDNGLGHRGFMSHAVPGTAAALWEGAQRPTHFDGVTMVVSKFFNIVTPHVACFGEKDYQQLAVLRQMVADMDFPVQIVGCPIVREPDGLAVSSRNRYMSDSQRQRALALWQSLRVAQMMFEAGTRDVDKIEQVVASVLQSRELAIDYAAIVDAQTLEPLTGGTLSDDGNAARLILAVRVDDTVRLIDNASLATPPSAVLAEHDQRARQAAQGIQDVLDAASALWVD